MATYTYTISATKSAWLNSDSPNTNFSTDKIVNAYDKSHFLLIGFDSSTYETKIKGKIVKSISLKVYMVQNGSTSPFYVYSKVGCPENGFTEKTITYNTWNTGGSDSRLDIFLQMAQLKNWPNYVTVKANTYSYGGSKLDDLIKAIRATAIGFSGGTTNVSQIETTRGTHPPQLIVEAEDSYPECTPLTPKNTYISTETNNTFTWEYSNANGDTQKKYEIQIKERQKDWTTVASGTSSATSAIVPAGSFGAGNISWRVRATSQYDIVGEWSEEASFTVQGKPAAPVVTVSSTSPQPNITWTGEGQLAYQVKIDGTVLQTAYSTDGLYKVKEYLSDGAHTAAVRIQNEYGLWSDWGTAEFTTANTPGDAITLSVAGGEAAVLTWSETEHESYYVLRDDVPIAKTEGYTYTDQMAIGTHKYKIRGTAGDSYSMSNEVTIALSVDAPEIAALDDMQWLRLMYSTAQNSPLGVSVYQDVSYQFYAGRRYPVAETSGQITRTYSFNVAFGDAAEAAAFEGLMGKTVIYRDQHGCLFTGPLMAYELSIDQFFRTFSCSVQQTDNTERVQYD